MLIWQHLALPFLAVLVLGVVDAYGRRQLASWLVGLGWDTCVLCLGAAPAIFLSANASHLCGDQLHAVCWAFAYIFTIIIVAGLVVGKFRGEGNKHEGHAAASLMIGGALISVLIYVAGHPLPAGVALAH